MWKFILTNISFPQQNTIFQAPETRWRGSAEVVVLEYEGTNGQELLLFHSFFQESNNLFLFFPII